MKSLPVAAMDAASAILANVTQMAVIRYLWISARQDRQQRLSSIDSFAFYDNSRERKSRYAMALGTIGDIENFRSIT